MERFFDKYEKTMLWLSLILGAITSLLMFDCKVSLSGDDSDYIMNAQSFIKHFTYPSGRGALYPIVISPFLIGGLHLILLKSLSAVFILLSMWLTYKALKGKIPACVLMPGLLILNICPYIYFYACYTYSEPFFMLVQALFVYLFSQYILNDERDVTHRNVIQGAAGLKLAATEWKKYLWLGLCFLAMGLTRTIGYAVMAAMILFFAFRKQWKNLLFSFGAATLVFGLFSLLKAIVWPDSGAPYGIAHYMAKNFYNPIQGMEDLAGYLNRLIFNSHVYLSGYTVKFMGFRSSSDLPLPIMPVLTVAMYVLYFTCLIIAHKYNAALFFVGLYIGVMNFASFVLLQTIWEQDRLIMIYYPLTLLFLLCSLYYLLRNWKAGKFKWLYSVSLLALLCGTGYHLKVKAGNNMPVLQENLMGNDLYGLTPDWENFIKMCRWVDKNIDKNAVVASRKPTISYMYTGRMFAGIFNLQKESIQAVVNQIENEKENNVFVIIDGNKRPTSQIQPYIQYAIIREHGNYKLNGENVFLAIVCKIDKATYNDEIIQYLNNNNLNYTTDCNAFLKQYIDDEATNYAVESPDNLLEFITNARIQYLLLPRIRLNTYRNSGEYLNAVHLHIAFIELKYPGAFKIIHTIGKDETCELAEFAGVNKQ